MSTDFEAAFQNEPVNFLLSNALRHLTQDQQRQLCNALLERLPIPDSIEDEAERLYPFPEDNESGVYDDLKNIREWCRSAHITCARHYMDTIEKLRALLKEAVGPCECEECQKIWNEYKTKHNL